METSVNEDSVLYEDSFQNMKVVELKQELKTRNLPITGTKGELLNRLIEATSTTKGGISETFDASLLMTDGNEDEILNDIPDSPMKVVSLFSEDKLSPEVPVPESKPPQKRVASSVGNDTVKKLCLNRATIIIPPPSPPKEAVSTHPKISSIVSDSADVVSGKKCISFSKGLTSQEKLALRAERFKMTGETFKPVEVKAIDQEVNEKSHSACQPFKVLPWFPPFCPQRDPWATPYMACKLEPVSSPKFVFKPITFDPVPDADKLKKRAERFGVVSTVLKKIEEKDKVQKRQLRFSSSETSKNDGFVKLRKIM